MDALEIRMEVKRLLREAREQHPDFEFIGDVDNEDIVIEALLHPERFEITVRIRDAE